MMIDELRQHHRLQDLLDCIGLARATFYYHLKQDKLAKTGKADNSNNQTMTDQVLTKHIKTIYHTHKGRYGYRRITLALNKLNFGFTINHKRVQRLMGEINLKAIIRKKSKYKSYRGQVGKICDNVLARDFDTNKPNHKWATDVTEFKVIDKQGITNKLYLSPIIDMFNGEIVSYAMNTRPNFEMVTDMLEKAMSRLNEQDDSKGESKDKGKGEHKDKPALILHSDQGWQYQMHHYQQLLKDNNITQSMSRKGNCLDNAVIESFFGTLKEEIFYEQSKFTSIDELKLVIDEYIYYYNHDRIKSKLKGLSPVEYRTKTAKH